MKTTIQSTTFTLLRLPRLLLVLALGVAGLPTSTSLTSPRTWGSFRLNCVATVRVTRPQVPSKHPPARSSQKSPFEEAMAAARAEIANATRLMSIARLWWSSPIARTVSCGRLPATAGRPITGRDPLQKCSERRRAKNPKTLTRRIDATYRLA